MKSVGWHIKDFSTTKSVGWHIEDF